MLTRLHGRVESDPMRVPTAAAMDTGRQGSFAGVLEEVTAAPPREQAPVREAPARDEAPAAPAPERDAAEPVQDEAEVEDAGTNGAPTDAAAADRLVAEQAAAAAGNDDNRRGEAVRQETAGKGTDSPRTSSAMDAEPLLAAVVMRGGAPAAAPIPTTAAGANPVGAVGSTKAAGQAPTRGVDLTAAKAEIAAKTAATTAGYKTASVAQATLLEQARDSVFKQILMKLTPEGGEMHVKLEPPELGELDLHLVVAEGNKLSLSISADQKDVAVLLQRHLDELKQTLQDAGLQITDAQVHARGDERNGQQHGGWRQQGGAEAQPAMPTANDRRGGYVSAEGLDFWV